MMHNLTEASCQLDLAFRRGAELVLLFDYDGTLAPFVDEPSRASMPDHTRRALERLRGLPRVHLGIISGRQLADLRPIVGIDGLLLAGTGGLELDFRGISLRHPRSAEWLPDLRLLAHRLRDAVTRFPGAHLEAKPLGMTLHYRKMRRHRYADLRAVVSQYVESSELAFTVYEGAAAFEIVPQLGWHKGTAVRMFLDSLRTDSPSVLYAGDSANDHDAMSAVLRAGGMTIGVGPDPPRSSLHTIADPHSLGIFLQDLAMKLAAAADYEASFPSESARKTHIA